MKPDSSEINYEYDADGNRTKRTEGGQSDLYTWDAENRLVSLFDASEGKTYQYRYDA